MKKTYTTPSVDLYEVEVEAGIAVSPQQAMIEEIWLYEANDGNPIW